MRAFRLEPATTPNVIGGYSGNAVTAGAIAATIRGGGESGAINHVTGIAATVGGGVSNTVTGAFGTVSGGPNNVAPGYGSTVGGGFTNAAGEEYSTIGGYG